MKKKYFIIWTVILIGVGLLLYPYINNAIFNYQISESKKEFLNALEIKKLEYKKEEGKETTPFSELNSILQKKNEILFKDKQKYLVDPFSYQEVDMDISAYGLEDNIIGYIRIPKINSELPILLGANHDSLNRGAAHLTQTSYPIGGINTNCVLAAHRGSTRGEMFVKIDQIEIGNKVYIENFQETLVYEVVSTKIIKPWEVNEILIQEGRDLVTLISCHPYWGNYERYVVYCERTNNDK